MSTGRDIILGRIREALQKPAPKHHSPTESSGHLHESTGYDSTARDWLPTVGPTFKDHVELFRKNSEALKTEFLVFDSLVEAGSALTKLATGWKMVGIHRNPVLESLRPALEHAGVNLLFTDNGYEKAELAACDAGITSCECLIAQTGSALVTASTCGGRSLSVLPPHHILIARREQLVPDLQAALTFAKQKFGGSYPSMMSFITGPSRTGDIERILVLGAHGPKNLTIFLVP
jgi:L-lactate dehydrogenase complex protein LldG